MALRVATPPTEAAMAHSGSSMAMLKLTVAQTSDAPGGTAPPSCASSCESFGEGALGFAPARDLHQQQEAQAPEPSCYDDQGDYGWFSDDVVDSCDSSDTSMAAIQREHQASVAPLSAASSASKSSAGQCKVQLRAHNPTFVLSTKCFDECCFAWGIGGFRIVRTPFGTRHAEYQLLACYRDCTTTAWVRASVLSKFAQGAERRGWGKACKAWAQVRMSQKLFRCLDVDYLLRKCQLLEAFLCQALFDARDVAPLLELVGATQQ